MIELVRGDILADTESDYIVVPVNCVGKPGKGLAKQWADQAPDHALEFYYRTCKQRNLHPGQILIIPESTFILAATKDHWFPPSQLDWIENILKSLNSHAQQYWLTPADKDPVTIALPKLGCGVRTGRLDWRDVKPLMEEYLHRLDAEFIVYE